MFLNSPWIMSSCEGKPPALRNPGLEADSRHSKVHLIHHKDPIKPQAHGEEIWCQVHYEF